MKHLDLFSGIGGFALATEIVWEDVEHIFVEYDPFCQEILKKHWPKSEVHGDIREFIAEEIIAHADERESNPNRCDYEEKCGLPKGKCESKYGSTLSGGSDCNVADSKLTRYEYSSPQGLEESGAGSRERTRSPEQTFLLTGGFPCQPFSQAGRRKGTADDRYLWPFMLECIALYRPRWVIAENVSGLITWNDGLVFETVCADMEKEGYEVCPVVIPACAVGAPHKRNRIWFVAHRNSDGREKQELLQQRGLSDWRSSGRGGETWSQNWIEVATRLCRVDDGIPRRLDRNPRLKALGNAIVPQVAAEIMRSIKNTETI